MIGGIASAMELDQDQSEPLRTNWEKTSKRSWEDVEEDGSGRIKLSEPQATRRRSHVVTPANIRRGLMRYCVVVIELSQRGMTVGDDVFRPSRAAAVGSLLPEFFKEYFDQNPISQLAVVVTRNKVAQCLTEFTGSARKHIAAIKEHVSGARFESGGDPSLQNALLMAHSMLSTIPQYGVREVVVLWGALTTVDPGDIFETIEQLSQAKVSCSVISMSAEMYICRHLTNLTNGQLGVAQDLKHLTSLLMNHAHPAPTVKSTSEEKDPKGHLISMGFPCSVSNRHHAFCACHNKVKAGGYLCPRCCTKMCDLPSTCQVCGLSLMSSSHLARSYHHLFPVPMFPETNLDQPGQLLHCKGCSQPFKVQELFECPNCHNMFCLKCDSFIHDALHVCPGCDEL